MGNVIRDNHGERLFDLCKNSLESHSNKAAVESYYLDNRKVKKRVISYKDLDHASTRVADVLSNLPGKTCQVIGVFLEPSIELIICILGITRLNYTFAPLEVSPSPGLLDKVINGMKTKYSIVTSDTKMQVEKTIEDCGYYTNVVAEIEFQSEYIKNLVVLEIHEETKVSDQCPVLFKCVLNDAAYILHTSGTTGTPKVICVPHSCIVPNVVHLAKIFDVQKSSKVALMSPPTFDPSIVEMFMSLMNYATLVVPSTEIKRDPLTLLDVLFTRAKVTVLQATPALMKRFPITALRDTVFVEDSSLTVMAFGGEACPAYDTICRWINPSSVNKKILPNSFYNIYGITEVSSWATCYKLPEECIFGCSDGSVPLGYPLLKTVLQIRQEDTDFTVCTMECNQGDEEVTSNVQLGCEWKLVHKHIEEKSGPFEFSGKLYIGGRERKCDILGEKDEEFRDSSDLVKVRISGGSIRLDYLGRSDTMIKRHGKKVYLHLITERTSSFPDVRSSCTLSVCKESGNLEIVSFLVRLEKSATAKDTNMCSGNSRTSVISSTQSKMWVFECFRRLSSLLDPAFLPDRIVEITSLPMTLHGKVDAKVLSALYQESREKNSGGGPCITKKELHDLVTTLLPRCLSRKDSVHLRQVDTGLRFEKSFVELGGDSFAAVFLINWMDIFLDVSLTEKIPDVFDMLLQNSLKHFIEILSQKLKAISPPQETKSTGLKKQKNRCLFVIGANGHLGSAYSESKVLSVSRAAHCVRSHEHNGISQQQPLKRRKYGRPRLDIKELWRYNTGKCIDASPLIIYSSDYEGRCFIGSHSHKFCALSLNNGEELWSIELPDRIESSASLYAGSGRDIIVVGCYDGGVYCLEASSGKVWWKFQTNAEVKSSPCWDQTSDFVFIGSHDGYLYALDIKERKSSWSRHCVGGAVFSSPAVLKETSCNKSVVFAGTLGGNLFCFACSSGEELWKRCVKKPIFSSPCADQSGVCIGCVDSFVYFFSLQGEALWSFQTGQPIFSSPCLDSTSGSIFIGSHDGRVYRLSISDGSLLWKSGDPCEAVAVYSSPFFVKTRDDTAGFVIFAYTSGMLCIVSGDDGEIIVKRQLPGELFSSPVVHLDVGLPDVDKSFERWLRIAIGCRDDNLYCFDVAISY